MGVPPWSVIVPGEYALSLFQAKITAHLFKDQKIEFAKKRLHHHGLKVIDTEEGSQD